MAKAPVTREEAALGGQVQVFQALPCALTDCWSQQDPGILCLCHRFSFFLFLAARGLSVQLGIQALRQGTMRLPLWEAESQLGLGLWVSHLELLLGLPQAEVPTDACQ